MDVVQYAAISKGIYKCTQCCSDSTKLFIFLAVPTREVINRSLFLHPSMYHS